MCFLGLGVGGLSSEYTLLLLIGLDRVVAMLLLISLSFEFLFFGVGRFGAELAGGRFISLEPERCGAFIVLLGGTGLFTVRIGGVGQGQLTKMVNQICIAGLLQGLSEGIAFATNAGLDPIKVINAISSGAAGSWQMKNRSASMIEGKYDFGFAVELMRKDLGICISEAVKNGSELPVTKLVDLFYSEIQQNGGHRFDTSSLLSRLPVIHNEKN